MTTHTLTRRELARRALVGAAGALLLTPAPAHADDSPSPPMPTPTNAPVAAPDAAPKDAAPKPPTEGEALLAALPLNVGYALSESQSKEAAAALTGYPGGFAKARAYPIPDDVAPAMIPTPPAAAPRRKGQAR